MKSLEYLFLKGMLIGLISFSFVGYGQNELTLADAVSKQYRDFYPDATIGVNWIPESNEFSYLEGYVTLMKSDVKGNASEIVSIGDVNKAVNGKLNWFSGFEWISNEVFVVSDGTHFYSYNVSSKNGSLICELDENTGDTKFNSRSKWTAFTVDNNIKIASPKGEITEVTSNTDLNIVSGQTISRSEFGITQGLFWSNDGGSLAFYQKDESKVADYPLLDNSETPGKLMSIKYPMAGQSSEKVKLGIYSIASKKTIFISPKNGEENYLTNVSWSSDDSFILIAEVNRDQNHMWLSKYDSKTGELLKVLFEEESDKWIEPEHPAYFMDGTDNSFVWISERDGYNNLYYYNSNGDLLKKLTDHRFVVSNIVSDVNNKIFYTATGDSPLENHLFVVDLKGRWKQVTMNAGTHQVQVSGSGRYIFDHYSSHDTPSIDQVIGVNGKLVGSVLKSDNKLNGYKLGSAEIKTLKAKDGTQLYTRMIKPSDFDSTKKYPVLIYVYGGPHAQLITNSWLDGASLWMYWMAEQGYIVYTVDNRGSANRGFAFESQIHRQLGTIEMEDQLTGVEFLKSQNYIDQNRIAVHGWSFGGFMTTSLMLRHPGVFTTGVAGGPVIDWKYYEIMYGERYMDRPEENPKGYEDNTLTNYVSDLEGNLMLIHGTVDDVVVMQHSLALVQKGVEEGVQFDFFPYPMHKHNVRGKDRVHLMTKVLNYILENNK